MKRILIRITAAALACVLLSGCSVLNLSGEPRTNAVELPIEHPSAVQTEELGVPDNLRPGIPVIPSGAEDFSVSSPTESSSSSSTSSSRFRPNIPSNFRDLLVNSSSAAEPIDIPEPDRSSLITDYTRKWGYNHLDAAQKTAYALLFESVDNKEYSYDFPDGLLSAHLDKYDIKKIYWAFDYDNAQFLELGSGFEYSTQSMEIRSLGANGIRPDSDGDGYAALYSEFDRATANILNNALQLPSGYEQLLYIHDWIVNNTEYRRNGPAYISEADGAILHGIALCEGYSKSFMYLAQALGYNCVCVIGKGNGEDHMWNMVELDGRWYHVDVTWDDPVTFSGEPYLSHDYFLISEDTICEDHYIENPVTIPNANSDYAR